MTAEMVISIALAALIAALVQCISHWFPWRMALGEDLPKLWAYVLGVTGFLLPVTMLYWYWEAMQISAPWIDMIGLWACVLSSGLAVWLAYRIDWLSDRVRRSHELEELYEAQTTNEQ